MCVPVSVRYVQALKAAHVGVSLSSAEASIAAPFTYLEPNIRCVPILLSEGRSALQTAFSLFRFIAMYSLIQFSAVILAYFVGSVLGNWQYLYQDMLVVFVLTLCIGATDASRQLSVKRPSANLLSVSNLLCVFVHMAICVAFQVFTFCMVSQQDGYVDYTQTNDVGDARTMQTTSLYYFSNYQVRRSSQQHRPQPVLDHGLDHSLAALLSACTVSHHGRAVRPWSSVEAAAVHQPPLHCLVRGGADAQHGSSILAQSRWLLAR